MKRPAEIVRGWKSETQKWGRAAAVETRQSVTDTERLSSREHWGGKPSQVKSHTRLTAKTLGVQWGWSQGENQARPELFQ